MPNYNVDIKERRQILVKKTAPPAAPYDGAKFMCKKFVGEDEVNYECYKKDYFDGIKAGEILDFDVELRLYGEGKYPHWVVTNIYPSEGELPLVESKPPTETIAPQERGMFWKHKAFSLSYAKDLVCHGIIEVEDIYKYAQEMFDWLNKPMV